MPKIQKHKYFGHLNTIIIVILYNLLSYVINIDVVSISQIHHFKS
jgi:hypothetical protein